MPELPEVETVVRTLARHTLGRRVERVVVRRRDVVRQIGPLEGKLTTTLLLGQRIAQLLRHGKQLALVGDTSEAGGACVCVHLGMSGSLCVVNASEPEPTGTQAPEPKADHVHVVWKLDNGTELRFRDPRRFGGVWTFPDARSLHERRWSRLGPDALVITPGQLYRGLSRTRRDLKAALLDQHLIAGLGNIYVDELLHATRLHPRKEAHEIRKPECERMVRTMRRILGRAIEAGGSTLRDYVDATGQTGGYQTRFRVYGRGGQPCLRCGTMLDTLVIAGRTTSACPGCQAGAGHTGE